MAIEYDGRRIPDDDAGLIDLIRGEAHRVVPWDYRDDRPPSPIDWVSAMLDAHPQLIPRVERAYARLLADADPVEVREVLEQAGAHPGNMAALLIEAIGEHDDTLRAGVDSTNDSRSLPGAAVEELASASRPAPLTAKAIQVLGSIDAPGDGWPASFRMAIAADFDAYRTKLVPTLQRLAGDDRALMAFIRGFVNAGPPLTDRGFEEIARGPSDLRDRVAEAVKQFLADAEASRQVLLDPKVLAKYPPEIRQRLSASRPDPWPDYAARLGVPA